MKVLTEIGEIWRHGFPALDDIEHFFSNYDEEEWSCRGQSAAVFTIYGAEGTENAEPFKDRIDVKLAIYDSPEFGMYLYYSKTGGGHADHLFSMGDASRLAETTLTRHGDPLSLGLFVPPNTAWRAVKDFIATNGERSPHMNWISGGDLPPEAFPEY